MPEAMRKARAAFDAMTELSRVDHPLCEVCGAPPPSRLARRPTGAQECTDAALDRLDVELRGAEEERRRCRDFLASSQREGDGGEAVEEEELAQLREEERRLLDELQRLQGEHAALDAEEAEVAGLEAELADEEARHWTEANGVEREQAARRDEEASVKAQAELSAKQLERLKRTNVFNDAFHIWHNGHFGTINGFRLGRLRAFPVEWAEIDAAWGQTVLLLHTMAHRLNIRTFSRYRLVPNGSFSRILCSDDKGTKLNLYHSRGFGSSQKGLYDRAMAAFLDCLKQFKGFVETRDPHFRLPYAIEGDQIGDSNAMLSIKAGNEEAWTKALKYVLTDLKWMLAWVCKQTPPQ